ncbi:MAG: hypothetical protein ACYS8W_13600 [Planctomycetota bacterium]
MKLSLPLKLGIFVVLLFGIVIAACFVWKPMKYGWLKSQLLSADSGDRNNAIEKLSKEGGAAVPYIRDWLRSGDARLIAGACGALEKMEQPVWQQVLPELEAILSGSDPEAVRAAAAVAFHRKHIWHRSEGNTLAWHSCWKSDTARKNLCLYVLLNATVDEEPDAKPSSKSPSFADWQTIRDKNDLFFRALRGLCSEEETDARIHVWFQSESMGALLRYGYAAGINSGGKEYIACVVGNLAVSVPGTSAQLIILIGKNGRILDSIGCGINSRYGGISTNVKATPAPDGAQFVINFIGNEFNDYWHNWHDIVYKGETFKFWDDDERHQPSDWNRKGLCRFRIENDRFKVLFPELKKEEEKK